MGILHSLSGEIGVVQCTSLYPNHPIRRITLVISTLSQLKPFAFYLLKKGGRVSSTQPTNNMKTKITTAFMALSVITLFASCTTIVKPATPEVTTQATTTTSAETNPYNGSTTYKKTTTTNY